MAILYAFDEHKNKVAFDANTPTPVTVPMKLPDGSILFYDRGEQYGEYLLFGDEVIRQSEGVDDGTDDSQNWRYLICDKSDLDDGTFQWGPISTREGLGDTSIGVGLPNTEVMLSKYADNNAYWWKLIKEKRDSTGLDWFMPSTNELYMMYDNTTVITGLGGDAFKTDVEYWASSEANISSAWYVRFINGRQNTNVKDNLFHCRLLRRI